MGTKTVRTTTVTDGANSDDPKVNPDLGPLFDLNPEAASKHTWTRVYREEPIDEGHLDDLPATGDKRDIKRRWGGGCYKVQAIDEKKKILATDGNVKIAGDPIFENNLAQKRYERWLRVNFGTDEKKDQKEATDQVALEEARHQREIARIHAEADREIAKAKAVEDAREAADERRRKRDREERLEAESQRRAEAKAERDAEREERRIEREERQRVEDARFKTEMELRRQELAGRSDPMTQLAGMVQIVTALRGGGEGGEFPDMPTAFAARLPETINAVVEAAAAAKAGESEKASGRSGPTYNPNKDVLLEGPLAARARAMISNLKRQGKTDDEIGGIMAGAFNTLAKVKAKPQAEYQPPAKKKPPAKKAKR